MASTTGSNGEPGPSRWYRQPRLHNNIENTQDMQKLEDHWSKMGDKIVQRINETDGANSRFHRGDVIKYNDARERERLFEILYLGAQEHRGIYFAYADHGDHIHAIHDCNNGGGSCR